MRERARRYAPLFFATAVVSCAVVGCAVDAAPPGDRGPLANDTSAGAQSEAARVQRFLDARYTAADVRHSFRTKMGETIDCVDFDAQPGVKMARAMGLDVPRPEPAPALAAAANVDPAEDYSFNGAPDDDGHVRACAGDSVPIIRVTAAEIAAAGGLDAYTRPPPPKAPPPGDCDYPGYAHVAMTMSTPAGAAVTGGGSHMAIYHPRIPSTGYHSLAQTWTTGGTPGTCGAPTSANPAWQTVEVGWTVDAAVNKGDGTNPHIFVFSTTDGYWSTGCYNNDPSLATGWAPTGAHCVPFVQTPGAKWSPGQILPASTAGSPAGAAAHELLGYTVKSSGNWYVHVTVDGSYSLLGYYPSITAPLTKFQVGGEVSAHSLVEWPLEMGSGRDPVWSSSNGLGVSAYHHDYFAVTNGSTWTYTGQLKMSPASASNDFGYSQYLAPAPGWGNFFYYGGAIGLCEVYPVICLLHL